MRSESTSTVWVTGAGGLIGNELVRSASEHAPHLRARGLTRKEVDLLDVSAVESLFSYERPWAIIHCAAMTQAAACETNPNLVQRTNVGATGHLVALAADIPFIFFSTDLVFDGTKGDYTEEDLPNPLSVYAETKAVAEEIVRKHPRHTIVRISLTGGCSPKGDRGFNEETKNAWRAGRTLNLFTDEFRCPIAAQVVARAVWALVVGSAKGIFHLGGAEKLSRYQIGQLLGERHPELNPKIIAGSRRDYKGPPRPADTSLDCSKIQRILSFRLPAFSEWLRQDQTGF